MDESEITLAEEMRLVERMRAELAAVTAQRDRLAESLRWCVEHLSDEYTNANLGTDMDLAAEAVAAARAALAELEP